MSQVEIVDQPLGRLARGVHKTDGMLTDGVLPWISLSVATKAACLHAGSDVTDSD